ncbi:hypothetical protein GCM10022381_23790 [Leifsonia kafniensis]|uniref:VOC domain-containing protein n=1 Tax=Leifsonia kafniensis TaxID=475957 RepID=A0ABP7KKF1_9MICO
MEAIGLIHFAIEIKDWDDFIAHLGTLGIEHIEEPNRGHDSSTTGRIVVHASSSDAGRRDRRCLAPTRARHPTHPAAMSGVRGVTRVVSPRAPSRVHRPGGAAPTSFHG